MSSSSSAIFNGTSRFSSDFQAVIARAVGIASLPMSQLNATKTTLAGQSASVSALDTKFGYLQTAIQSLQTATGTGSLASTVSIPGIVQPTIGAGATEGSYSIEVTNLGSYTSTSSADGLPVVTDPSKQNISSSSSYTLTVNGSATTISPAGTGLDALVTAINTQPSLNVQASVVNIGSPSAPDYRLSLQSSKLGPNTLQLNDGSRDLLNTAATGTLATYKVNGLNLVSSSDSRTITLAPGLTVGLVAQSASSVATDITVARNGSTFSNALSSFVNAYNGAVDELAKSRGTTAGPLAGQSIVNTLSSTLRQVLNYSNGTGGISSLTSLGISADTTGHLSLDPNAFASATTGNFTSLLAFLGTPTGGGFLQSATQAFNGVEDQTTGVIKTTLTSLAAQSATEDTLIAQEQDRVNRLQTNLQAQFAKADALIASLEQQDTFFTGLFQAFLNPVKA
ncbi:MAG: flagellar filament capping protein FliD [Bryobacteraceae bacterium]